MLIYMSMIDNDMDKTKFENLYNTYKKIMFFKAMEILKDEHLAEDAVHQAFIKIIENIGKIDENNCHKTKGFIVVVIENTAIDVYRKLSRNRTISFDEVEYVIKDISPSVEDTFEENDENLIVSAITSLPPNYSTVIRLKYSHGYNDIEIARILDISEDNVRQRISRGKKRLAKILDRLEEEHNG